jgi:hypothetical protein
VLVEHHDGRAGQWAPDRDRPPRLQFRHRAGHGRLGRAVGVEHPPAAAAPALHQFGGARLPADVHRADRGERAVERREHRRDAVEHRDGGVLEEVRERGPDAATVDRAGHEGRADRPGRPDLLDREVERDGHALVDAVGVGHAVQLRDHGEQAAHARVRHLDALGAAGRPRGVDDVGEGITAQWHGRMAGRRRGDLVRDAVEFDVGDGQPVAGVGERRAREHEVEACVLGDERQAVGRHGGVDRHERRARLGDREERGVHGDGAFQQEPDPAADGQTVREEVVGEPVGPLVQLRVGQHLAVALERHRGGPAIDRTLEDVLQAPGPAGGGTGPQGRSRSDRRRRLGQLGDRHGRAPPRELPAAGAAPRRARWHGRCPSA